GEGGGLWFEQTRQGLGERGGGRRRVARRQRTRKPSQPIAPRWLRPHAEERQRLDAQGLRVLLIRRELGQRLGLAGSKDGIEYSKRELVVRQWLRDQLRQLRSRRLDAAVDDGPRGFLHELGLGVGKELRDGRTAEPPQC